MLAWWPRGSVRMHRWSLQPTARVPESQTFDPPTPIHIFPIQYLRISIDLRTRPSGLPYLTAVQQYTYISFVRPPSLSPLPPRLPLCLRHDGMMAWWHDGMMPWWHDGMMAWCHDGGGSLFSSSDDGWKDLDTNDLSFTYIRVILTDAKRWLTPLIYKCVWSSYIPSIRKWYHSYDPFEKIPRTPNNLFVSSQGIEMISRINYTVSINMGHKLLFSRN
jgi:hypothetical protein